jgi:hypothetical protein
MMSIKSEFLGTFYVFLIFMIIGLLFLVAIIGFDYVVGISINKASNDKISEINVNSDTTYFSDRIYSSDFPINCTVKCIVCNTTFCSLKSYESIIRLTKSLNNSYFFTEQLFFEIKYFEEMEAFDCKKDCVNNKGVVVK